MGSDRFLLLLLRDQQPVRHMESLTFPAPGPGSLFAIPGSTRRTRPHRRCARAGAGRGSRSAVDASVRGDGGPGLRPPRLALARILRSVGRLTPVAITGTNGKTTVTYLLEAISRPPAIAGVLGKSTTAMAQDVRRPNTTYELQRFPPDGRRGRHPRRRRGLSRRGLETWTGCLRYRVCTVNLLDHLDYHVTMERYYAAKRFLPAPPAVRDGLPVSQR